MMDDGRAILVGTNRRVDNVQGAVKDLWDVVRRELKESDVKIDELTREVMTLRTQLEEKDRMIMVIVVVGWRMLII